MSERRRIDNRRASLTFNFVCGRHEYTATVSYFSGTDQLAEIFLGNGRAGSDVDAASKDSAILASLCLQHGASVTTIRRAINHGSPLACALDLLVEDRKP